MLNDYKGEKPNNVITEEEHKKRPFYKKVSFWVLSALGLFFGGCSVYGLVLGYQYVHAVTEAAHIIAEAQSDEADSSFPKKYRLYDNASGAKIDVFDMGDITWSYWDQYGFFTAESPANSAPIVTGSSIPFVCAIYSNSTPYALMNSSVDMAMCINGGHWTSGNRIGCRNSAYSDPVAFKNAMRGVLVYYKTYDGYTGSDAYDKAYQEGYDEGHQDGYQEGYSDGSDAINLPQSVKVLLPVGNEYSVQYKSYVDGVVDRQGQLNSSQTGGAYATFDRSRTQKLRIDLTLPSGSRAFFLYTPSWTSAYPTDENYSLRQSWAVSGVTYLPTWVAKPQIYVGVTSADVPDLTYETVSVAFDVDHWGDIKVGAYSQGYNDGYQAGEENPTAYDSGYDAGYEQGYDDGHTIGVAQGESQAVSGQKALVNMFVTAFQQPFDQIYRFLNFNVLGLNILALFTALLTLSIGIIIIKKVI